MAAVETRPSSLCYLHLLQGGEAIGEVAADATAFGCRDWDFACVVTGVWPRDQEGTEAAQSAVRWVYSVAGDLLSLSSGAYGADLGPDPRDTMLATKAFGANQPRLARLKRNLDPHNVLAYTCPLPKESTAAHHSCHGRKLRWQGLLCRRLGLCVSQNVPTKDSRRVQSASAMWSSGSTQRLLVPTWAASFGTVPIRSNIGQRWPDFTKNRCGNDLGCQRNILWA